VHINQLTLNHVVSQQSDNCIRLHKKCKHRSTFKRKMTVIIITIEPEYYSVIMQDL